MRRTQILFNTIVFSIIIISCNNDSATSVIEAEDLTPILTDYFVLSIDFDSKGTAWIGTLKQGLIRYDGKVTHYDNTNSILSDTITISAIAVDASDNVWIGSDIGLIKYHDPDFVIFDKSNSPVTQSIRSLAVDHEQSVWFTAGNIYEGGVMQYKDKIWNLYTPENSELPNTVIYDITIDQSNNKWFTSPGTLLKFASNKWVIFNSKNSGYDFNWIGKIASGKQNDVWISFDYSVSSIAMHDEDPTIVHFNGADWQRMDPPKFGDSEFIISEIFVDSKGNFWLARCGELIYYNQNQWKYCTQLPNTIFDIKEDQSGQIWLGTGDGIYKITP